MRNVYLLPTVNLSRLILQGSELVLSKYMEENEGFSEFNQHIYITSDEDIKSEDWVLFRIDDIIEIVRITTIIDNAFDSKEGFGYGLEYCKKITLTTDQDLIKDGVQDIDEEFLEWFINNPRCEYIKVDNELNIEGKNGLDRARFIYKIIIPKEESKQETLEEAAKAYGATIGNINGTAQFDFIRGANWQKEQLIKLLKKNDYENEPVFELIEEFFK